MGVEYLSTKLLSIVQVSVKTSLVKTSLVIHMIMSIGYERFQVIDYVDGLS